jgi:hypothetical protein
MYTPEPDDRIGSEPPSDALLAAILEAALDADLMVLDDGVEVARFDPHLSPVCSRSHRSMCVKSSCRLSNDPTMNS